jgi:hypothetical protein
MNMSMSEVRPRPDHEHENAQPSHSAPVRILPRSSPLLAVAVLALTAAFATGCSQPETGGRQAVASVSAPKTAGATAAQSKYTCPMHPEVVSDTPGRCPKCGMDLVPVDQHKGHTHSVGQNP